MSLCSEKPPVELDVMQKQSESELEVVTEDIERIQYPVHYKGLTKNMQNTTKYEWTIESFVNTITTKKVLRTDKFVVEPFQENKAHLELQLKDEGQLKFTWKQPIQDLFTTPIKAHTTGTPNIFPNTPLFCSNIGYTAEPICKSARKKVAREIRTGLHNRDRGTLSLTPNSPVPYKFPNADDACNAVEVKFPNSNLNITPCSSQPDTNLASTENTICKKKGNNDKYLSFYLINHSTGNSPSWITVRATTINVHGKEICSKLIQESNSEKYSKIGFDRYLDLKDIEAEDIIDDSLTIHCEIVCYCNTIIQQISNIPYVPRDIADTINKIIDADGLKDPDFIFRCEGKDIRLHKSALSAQSTEMAAIFEAQSFETMGGVKNIEADYETMLEMVRFIYTGRVQNLNRLAPKLLCVAERYKLKSLKTLCEKNLYNNLTVENAAETLLLADEYQAEGLESEVLFFIKKHVYDVINSDGYKNIESASKVPSKILRMIVARN